MRKREESTFSVLSSWVDCVVIYEVGKGRERNTFLVKSPFLAKVMLARLY
jgi:hypothetical protein